jgi:hypothetical protein
VSATNLDIVFSGELMHFILSCPFEHGAMHRIDRYDVYSHLGTKDTVFRVGYAFHIECTAETIPAAPAL